MTVLRPKTPPRPASALPCVWRQKLNVASRSPRGCLWASPRSDSKEFHQIQSGRGQRAVSQRGNCAWKGSGVVAGGAVLQGQLQVEGRSLTLRKPSQGYLLVANVLFTSCCEVQRPAGFPFNPCPLHPGSTGQARGPAGLCRAQEPHEGVPWATCGSSDPFQGSH